MENPKKLYIDSPSWSEAINEDDFIVTIGKTKSNSVYHISEVKAKPRPELRMVRYYVKAFKSDLLTCLQREPHQKLIPITWYSRDKK